MNESWYQEDVTDESLEEARKASTSPQKRLWLKPDTSRKVVFLDDRPFCFWEHNPKINGEFKNNWFSCRKGLPGGCPMCNSRVQRYYIGFVTILDVEGFVSKKDGKHIKNFRQLLPMRMKTLKQFKAIRQRKTTLVGAKFDLVRTSREAASCGDVFDFIEYVDLEDQQFWHDSKLEGKKVPPEPFDYKKIFEPMSVKDMMGIGMAIGGEADSHEAEGEDEDALY